MGTGHALPWQTERDEIIASNFSSCKWCIVAVEAGVVDYLWPTVDRLKSVALTRTRTIQSEMD